MFKLKTPLETVATLSGVSCLDIDTNQANRYAIKLNGNSGKETYYFGTPIYNVSSRNLVNRKFVMKNGCYNFAGSNCEVTVSATQLTFLQDVKEFRITLPQSCSWTLEDGVLVSNYFSVIPTYNGLLINGRIDQLAFDASIKFSYTGIRTSQSCVCFMESQFRPVLVVSALYAKKQNNGCQPMQIKYTERAKSCGSICFVSENMLYNQGVVEINFYEPKLIQDTPVSGKRPKENNAYGPIAFIGKSTFYGTQWLYSRLDLNKMPELQHKHIREMKLFIPRFTNSSAALDIFGLQNRFCSFGSNWSNKAQKDKKLDGISIMGDYVCVDLTNTYVKHGHLTEAMGMVITPSRLYEYDYHVISTGDSYAMPPILCVKYAN